PHPSLFRSSTARLRPPMSPGPNSRPPSRGTCRFSSRLMGLRSASLSLSFKTVGPSVRHCRQRTAAGDSVMAVHDLFVYLRAQSAERAVEFYKQVFGATERFRLVEPSGRIGHVELELGGTTLMLSDEFPEFDIHAPDPEARSSFVIHLHVDDADAMIDKALAAGARLVRPPQDHFYGERSGTIRDPFGYNWMIGHSIEAVEPAEMQRRYTEMLSGS